MNHNPRPNPSDLLEQLVQQAISAQTFPGVELLLTKADKILYHKTFGFLHSGPKSPVLRKNALFDLASLTKPLATAVAVMILVDRGQVYLEDRICKFIPEFLREDTRKITLKQLLTHSSGLPAHNNLFDKDFDRQKGFLKLVNLPLITEPGTKVCYSCMGYLLLGEMIRRVSQQDLKEFCAANIFNPLGIKNILFRPDPTEPDMVPTTYCPLRKKILCGETQDENAHLFKDEGGNAGLFGRAEDIHLYLQTLLGGDKSGSKILSAAALEVMNRNQTKYPLYPRTIAWDYYSGSPNYWSCGDFMPLGSLGHLGFTGTSLWFNTHSKIMVLILSSRLNVTLKDNQNLIMDFRPKAHNILLSMLTEI